MKIVFTPDWFLNENVLINFFSFVVLSFFTILSYKSYKLDKNKKILYLSAGFALIALAQFAGILTKLVLYYDVSFTQSLGQMMITYQVIKSVDIFYQLGFFFFRLLSLMGLYIIYKLPIKKEYTEDFFLALFFITIISLLSKDMIYLFYLTSLLLLGLITKNYYHIYSRNKSKNTLMLFSAFAVLALSNVILVFFCSHEIPNVIANIIELVSYITLLFLIIRIQHGAKKKSDGHNLRHIGDNTG
jgi:hypothetical protein